MSKKIALLIGSLRKESIHRKIANEMIRLSPEDLEMEIVEINMPLYNEDLDGKNPPQEWTNFRNKISEKQGVIFLSPEYNRTISGALKNAIDIGSRPSGKNVFQGKPGAILSASPGAIGGFGANHNVRQAVVFLDVYMMQQPEVYLGNAANSFQEDNKTLNERTEKFVVKFLENFKTWADKF